MLGCGSLLPLFGELSRVEGNSDRPGQELPYPGVVFEESYWRWPGRDRAGNTIDFFVQVLDMSFHQGMHQILGDGP